MRTVTITMNTDSRKNGTTASIWLHGHDTLVEKYDAISLVWTEVK